MENKLFIRNEASGNESRLILDGRLDANWSGYLDDFINNLVREGHHRLILNMSGVLYLSSAGIRILISQYKNIKKLGGLFLLENLSEEVAQVLDMAGIKSVLTEDYIKPQSGSRQETTEHISEGYCFKILSVSEENMILKAEGNPGLMMTSGFKAENNSKIKLTEPLYAIGLGAIGEGFDDCKDRFGEFIALGDVLAYKPSDGSKLPDYAVTTGRLVPEINALYYILASGQFSKRISFEPVADRESISLGALVTGMSIATNLDKFVFLSIAECEGLVGANLNASPVDSKNLFEYPYIRDSINFTTESGYQKMLTVSLGFFYKNPGERVREFLRPVKPGAQQYIHTHSAIFPYMALPKNEMSAGNLVKHLFENSIILDVLHLLNDSREISGLGESTFRQGVVWIGQFNETL